MNDVDEYVAQVRAALADLPPQVREELLEDLPAHLAEVAAEGAQPLRSRLGPPAQYAAELRATIEVGRSAARPPAAVRLAAAVDAARGRLRTIDVGLGPVIGYARASDYLRLLRPGWWLLRGYLAAMAVAAAVDAGTIGLLPRVGGSVLVALAILAAFVVGSIWLGRRQASLPQWGRHALTAASAVLAVVAVVGFATVDEYAFRPGGGYYSVVDNTQYSDVRDVFGYDANGQLLRDARLFDQDGDPLILGGQDCEPYLEPSNIYPRCPDQAPFTVPGISPTPAPTATVTLTPTATPTPSLTQTPTPSLPATPTPSPTASR